MAGKKRVPARMKAKQEWKPQGFTKKEWITIGIVVGVIAVLILGYFLLRDFFDGSLRISGGMVQAEDNWIVVNTGTSSSPKYFKLGEISPVDGYALATEHYTGDENVPTFFYTPETAGAIDDVTIIAAKGVAQEMAANVSASYASYLQNAVASGVSEVTIAGRTGWAFSCDYEEEQTEAEATAAPEATPAAEATMAPEATPAAEATPAPVVKAARVVNIYFDASHGMSVLTGITAKADTADQLPSVEDLYKAMEPFVQGMTIDGVAQPTAAPAAVGDDGNRPADATPAAEASAEPAASPAA